MPRKFAILDTNIIDYGLKPDYAESVASLIRELSKEFDLTTTQYSRFELFRGMNSEKIPAAKVLFDSFACVDIDGDVFKTAAALSTCYKNDLATKSRAGSFSDGDILIASASFIANSVIVTADVNDFPRPYFLEHASSNHRIVSSRKKTTIQVGILAPNIPHLNNVLPTLYPSPK